MLARQRQARILAELHRRGAVRVSELTEDLDVSDMTIRRDLDRLAAAGLVEKVHGGAVLVDAVTAEPGFAANLELAAPAKRAIAAAAAGLISPGSAIAVSAGSTTWALAEHVATIEPLTVVTNSTAIADTIASVAVTPGPTVLLTGGARTPSAALVGPLADATLRSLSVDQVFLGVHGLSSGSGLSTPNLAEADTNRTMIGRADQLVVLADSTKWGRRGLATFAGLDEVDILISDRGLPVDAVAELRDRGVEVRLVDPHPAAATGA